MGFPDFPYPDKFELSFISSADVLEYLNLYADHFKLRNYIKFQHEVIRVKPRLNMEWEASIDTHMYACMFVCLYECITCLILIHDAISKHMQDFIKIFSFHLLLSCDFLWSIRCMF